MANLTITVDEGTLRRARIRALERGESVNSYLAEALRRYAGGADQDEVVKRLLATAQDLRAGHEGSGRSWSRDSLHRV